jgi:hypothetical protein
MQIVDTNESVDKRLDKSPQDNSPNRDLVDLVKEISRL